ncbi:MULTISPECIES: hypothetical protein [Protofrankia]|uniref:hypothetical protein n=1 Tax=Protofrankia TaxID=2994361 RepID=UPI00031785ED|nr:MULTISPECIES: hypothetical protein [Protofrankia]
MTDEPDVDRTNARPASPTIDGLVRIESVGTTAPDPAGSPGDTPPRPGSTTPTPPGTGEEDTAGESAEECTDTAAADTGARAPAAHRWGRRTTVAGGLLAAAAVTLTVLTVLWAGTWRADQARTHDRAAALQAARQSAVNLTTINFATADQDIQRILASGTGEFADQFATNIDSYKDLVRQGKVITTGEVKETGLVSLDRNTAKVAVALSSTVKNDQTPDGEERFYRMLIEVHRQSDGHWLASRVEFVQ